jgi:hypothetical protein
MLALERFKRKLLYSLIGGLLCYGIFKLFMYATDRAQFEDSNLLVSCAFIVIATIGIYLVLAFISLFTSSRK